MFVPFQKAVAQQNITGRVLDKTDNNPVQEANVILIPSGKGTYTDSTGYFMIKNVYPGKYILSISMVGYKKEKREIRVSGNGKINLKILMERENKNIGEVSVIGSRVEQRRIMKNITVEPLSLEASESVIARDKMEKQGAVTLIDGMKYVPGGLTETRGRKVKQFFSVRGQTYPYPSYSIDGIMQKEFYETAPFLNVGTIEKITIDRSASALLKSLSPLSGVIDVKTRRYTRKETGLWLKYGSLNSFDAGIQHGNKIRDFEYSGGASFSGTNGPPGRNGRERIVNLNTHLGWKVNEKINSSIEMFYLGGSRQFVQPVEPADQKFRDQKEEYKPINTFLIASKVDYKTSSIFSGELQINFAYRNPVYHIEMITTGETNSYAEKDHELTINHLNSWKLSEANILRFGILYNHWVSPHGKRYYYGNRADVHTWSAVMTDQQRFGKWVMDAGFRISREYYKDWAAFSIEGSGKKFKNVEPITDEWQSPVWQATGGATWSGNALLSFHANLSTGIVTPRKGALTADSTRPDNEKRTNLDLSLEKNYGHSGSLTMTAFMVSRVDAIEYSGKTMDLDNGMIVELYTNENKWNYGLEIEGKFNLINNLLQGFVNMVLMQGQVKKKDQWFHDDEIPSIIANAGMTLQKAGFDLNFFLNYTGPFKNNRFVSKDYLHEYGKAPLGNFTVIDMTTGYTVGKRKKTRFFLEIKNMLNTPYQTVPGWPDYGRRYNLGINLKF